MYELILLLTLTLPLLAVSLAGRHFERGLAEASLEALAKRRYELSWLITLALIGQMLLLSAILFHWADRMVLLEQWLEQLAEPIQAMVDLMGLMAATAILAVTGGLIAIGYLSLYALPWQRLDRAIKRLQGRVEGKQPPWRSLRRTLAALLPQMLWISLAFAQPPEFFADPARVGLLLVGYLLTVQSVSPWLLQLATPTVRLPADHPVTQMAMELSRAAGVSVGAVRLMILGEAKVANALVSGLWPWLRSIYVTDHMLATFSTAEIRSILAHEVGHLRHRHLWCYFGFALGGALVIPQAAHLLGYLDFFRDLAWSPWITIALYWGVMFKFFSRRFERQADRYAVQATGDVVTFQRALEKLAEVNGTVRQYAKWDIFQSHPPIAERVRALE